MSNNIEYIPFDPSMIGQKEIIIWCPDKDDYAELMQLMGNRGVHWGDGSMVASDSNHSFGDRHCVRLTTDLCIKRADQYFYENGYRDGNYSEYTFVKYPGIEVTVNVEDLL